MIVCRRVGPCSKRNSPGTPSGESSWKRLHDIQMDVLETGLRYATGVWYGSRALCDIFFHRHVTVSDGFELKRSVEGLSDAACRDPGPGHEQTTRDVLHSGGELIYEVELSTLRMRPDLKMTRSEWLLLRLKQMKYETDKVLEITDHLETLSIAKNSFFYKTKADDDKEPRDRPSFWSSRYRFEELRQKGKLYGDEDID
ncbi:hypothetical protein ILUMI_22222 [Ignelater luminosus]|uniref:Uncharacterized protein n=1 Tax=Ignelater luminosus TaxID=2038154 RepID=A0A8K0G309_IGNLU|nr:hypothetical protein ILUMI_22222 [Ignelater luminosus]